MVLLYSFKLPLGWQASDFSLKGIDDKVYKLVEIKPKIGILIVFTCNHCPYAQAAWPLLVKLYEKYYKKGIEFVAINPNDEESYPEDSFEKMKKKAKEWQIVFPYLRDETQEVAKAYQAQCTPDIYLFDANKKLFYHGRINDNWQNPLKVTRNDLDEALRRLCIGDKPPVEQFPSMGCSIKWK